MIGRRRFLALSAALPALVTGCGWEPLYANRDTAVGSADLRAIKVMPIPERIGQQLEFGLRRSFNPDNVSTKQTFALRVTLQISLQNLSIQSQGLGTRGEVQLSGTYQLVELATNKALQSGNVHAVDSFDIQANGYSTVVAQNDASTRVVEEVRREIVGQMTLYMQNKLLAGL